jgi:hypothetical protein
MASWVELTEMPPAVRLYVILTAYWTGSGWASEPSCSMLTCIIAVPPLGLEPRLDGF